MRPNIPAILGATLLASGLAACSTATPDARVSELQSKLSTTEQQNVALEQQLSELSGIENKLSTTEGERQKLADELADLRSQPAAVTSSAPVAEPMLPPGAKPGECYARVFVPPTYQTTQETVLKTQASEKVDVIPAQYEWIEERVLVREASERIETIPATYKKVTERVLVKPASERLETNPATYVNETERVLVREAYTTWKKGRGPIEKVDDSTGEIMCLVTIPAEYKTVTKRVLKTPATTSTITIPAEYETITKTVVDAPATTRTIAIPAEYSTVKVRKLVRPAQEKRTPIPAEYQTVSKTEKVSDGEMEWRPILCETNVTSDVVKQVQRALKAKGFNPGRIDGVLGAETMSAVSAFQRANNLPRGQLTMGTLRALNIPLAGEA